jgi:phosphate transport system substrate-binding protein
VGETKRHRTVAALVVLLAVVGAACAKTETPGGLSGTVNGDGSSTVFPITEAVAEEFKAENPGVDITVGESGTGGGFEKFCSDVATDRTDIQDASRPIEDDEKADCVRNEIEYVELNIAKDGLAVVVSKENDWVDCLTTVELKKIWNTGSTIKNWNEIRSSFPDEPLKLFGPGTDSGTFDYFTSVINGEEGASRSDYTPSEDDNVLVTGVASTKGGLGYFGYAYYAESTDKLNLVSVDPGSGCVTPTNETVASGAYTPLSRPLFLYVSTASIGKPQVKAFVEFYMDNVSDLVNDVGYTPLDDAALAGEVAEWKAAAGG